MGRDRGWRLDLVIALANRLYEVECGRFSGSPDDLVSPYLDRLSEGYTANDPPIEAGTPSP